MKIKTYSKHFKTTRFFTMMHSTLHPTFYDIPIQDLTFLAFLYLSHAPEDWNIYLYMYHKFQPNVGKYSSPMEHIIPGGGFPIIHATANNGYVRRPSGSVPGLAIKDQFERSSQTIIQKPQGFHSKKKLDLVFFFLKNFSKGPKVVPLLLAG